MKIINPYEGIDFANCSKVNAITHEHITSKDAVKNAYDRGIRWFAFVNYMPACPPYPLSGKTYIYKGYKDLEDDTIIDKEYNISTISFTDKDGNVVNTDSLPQIPNAEHPKIGVSRDSTLPISHFNVLGNIYPECGHDTNPELTKNRPMYYFDELESILQSGEGMRMFGTINHTPYASTIKKMVDSYPNLFRCVEVFNQGYTRLYNERMRNAYDKVLSQGYRLWCTSVIDWQGYIEKDAYDGEDVSSYLPECDFDRGCNVLYINDYDGKSVSEKSILGLDTYHKGAYTASGLGTHHITSLEIYENIVRLSVSGNPTMFYAITNKGKTVLSGNNINFKIDKGVKYLRFEAYYYDDDMDFLFTQPLFVEDNDSSERSNIVKKLLILE